MLIGSTTRFLANGHLPRMSHKSSLLTHVKSVTKDCAQIYWHLTYTWGKPQLGDWPRGKESTEVRKSQNKGKESENSYQKLKRSPRDRHTKTHGNRIEIFQLARPSLSIGRTKTAVPVEISWFSFRVSIPRGSHQFLVRVFTFLSARRLFDSVCATKHHLKWGPLPPNKISRIT